VGQRIRALCSVRCSRALVRETLGRAGASADMTTGGPCLTQRATSDHLAAMNSRWHGALRAKCCCQDEWSPSLAAARKWRRKAAGRRGEAIACRYRRNDLRQCRSQSLTVRGTSAERARKSTAGCAPCFDSKRRIRIPHDVMVNATNDMGQMQAPDDQFGRTALRPLADWASPPT